MLDVFFHDDAVYSLCVHVWSVLLCVFRGEVLDVFFHDDAVYGLSVRVWSVLLCVFRGEVLDVFFHDDAVYSLSVRVWSVLLCVFRGEVLDVFFHDDAVYGLSVDPLNDNVFASACDDGRILIYDTRAPASNGQQTFSFVTVFFIMILNYHFEKSVDLAIELTCC